MTTNQLVLKVWSLSLVMTFLPKTYCNSTAISLKLRSFFFSSIFMQCLIYLLISEAEQQRVTNFWFSPSSMLGYLQSKQLMLLQKAEYLAPAISLPKIYAIPKYYHLFIIQMHINGLLLVFETKYTVVNLCFVVSPLTLFV